MLLFELLRHLRELARVVGQVLRALAHALQPVARCLSRSLISFMVLMVWFARRSASLSLTFSLSLSFSLSVLAVAEEPNRELLCACSVLLSWLAWGCDRVDEAAAEEETDEDENSVDFGRSFLPGDAELAEGSTRLLSCIFLAVDESSDFRCCA